MPIIPETSIPSTTLLKALTFTALDLSTRANRGTVKIIMRELGGGGYCA